MNQQIYESPHYNANSTEYAPHPMDSNSPSYAHRIPWHELYYALAILFPLFGIIVGCTFHLKDEAQFARRLFLTSGISATVMTVLSSIVVCIFLGVLAPYFEFLFAASGLFRS